MKWWGWLDLFGRLLLLGGLILQLDLLQWLQSLEMHSLLIAIVENQNQLRLALQEDDVSRLWHDMSNTGEIYDQLNTAQRQKNFASVFNLALVGIGSAALLVARYCELRSSN